MGLEATPDESSGVAVLQNAGDGTFEELGRVWLGDAPRLLIAGDFDTDGDADLLARGTFSHEITLIVNRGDGTFLTFFNSLRGQTNTPKAVVPVDGDSDGDLDLAWLSSGGSRSLSFLWNLEFEEGLGSGDELSFRRKRAGAAGTAGALADFDGDGWLDSAEMAITGLVSLRFNDGSGNFGTTVRIGDASGNGGNTLFARDMDADGDVDIVASTAITSIFENDGTGTFRTRRSAGAGNFSSVAAIDLNGDGALDLVSADSLNSTVNAIVSRGPGDLRFRLVRIFQVGVPRDPPVGRVVFSPAVIVAGDFDGDGRGDFVVGESTTTSELKVFLGGPDLDFSGNSVQWAPSVLPSDSPTDMLATDLDGDGDLDLATCSFESSTVSIFDNPGDGAFTRPLALATDSPPHSLAAADIDGDAQLDLVTVNVDRTMSFFRGLGGVFLPPEKIGEGVKVMLQRGNRQSRLGYVVAGDIDRDGDVDLLSGDQISVQTSFFENDSPGSLSIPYAERICTERDFRRFSVPSTQAGTVERVAKFVVPVDRRDPDAIPPLFQNVWRFPLHQEFLQEVFPEHFPALSPDSFDRLVNRRASREYFVGVVSRLRTADGPVYGLTILLAFDDLAELPTAVEVRSVYETLKEVFELAPLAYFPATKELIETAERWEDPGFPIHYDDPTQDVAYQPYTRAVGFGRVRLLSQAEFEEANDSGEISFQDILVLERAPRDIEGVFGGVITAEVQGELSHLALRTARRGTPNAFVREALESFAPFAGQLVRLEVTESEYSVRLAEAREAQEFWEQSRRQVAKLPGRDGEFTAFSSLAEMDLDPREVGAEARFGGKATHLARLQRILTGPWAEYRERGFAIPIRYYLEFLAGNRLPSAVDPERDVTYEEYLAELFADAEFQNNSRFRFEALAALRRHMRESGVVDERLIVSLAERIDQIFRATNLRVRFRSSSNVEDALEFNGAGLYDSTSVCAADDLDGDLLGPSICDPTRPGERGIARGLKRVWSSLWNFRAYEEREFFGIPQELAAMGILVNRAFIDERANGVAFTGNPGNPLDRRYLITVQAGEEPVVSPEPGVIAEKDLLEVVDGEVVNILRATRSSLIPGSFVLSDGELQELGRLLWHIDRELPIDLGDYRRSDVLLDIEFKIEATGELAVKQVRPFLLGRDEATSRTLIIEVASDNMVCRPFEPGVDIRRAEARKLSVHFAPGRYEIPSDVENFEMEFQEEVRIPGGEVVGATEPGTLEVRRVRGAYVLDYSRRFETSAGEPVVLRLSNLVFPDDVSSPFVLDHRTLGPPLTLILGEELTRLESCSLRDEQPTDLTVTLLGGGTLRLRLRHSPPNPITWMGPTRFTAAELVLPGDDRFVDDYWKLVYRADRHHENSEFRIYLDPPLHIDEVDVPAHRIDVRHQNMDGLGQEQAFMSFVGEDGRSLRGVPRELRPRSTSRRPVQDQPLPARGRGSGWPCRYDGCDQAPGLPLRRRGLAPLPSRSRCERRWAAHRQRRDLDPVSPLRRGRSPAAALRGVRDAFQARHAGLRRVSALRVTVPSGTDPRSDPSSTCPGGRPPRHRQLSGQPRRRTQSVPSVGGASPRKR